MTAGYINTLQIINNNQRISKGYAFDDITNKNIVIKNPQVFHFSKGFSNQLIVSNPVYNISMKNTYQYISKLNISSKISTRIVVNYNSMFTIPDGFQLFINDEEVSVYNLPNDSGLSSMTNLYGLDLSLIYKNNYKFKAIYDSKELLLGSLSEIFIDDEFIDNYWSQSLNRFSEGKLRLSLNFTSSYF